MMTSTMSALSGVNAAAQIVVKVQRAANAGTDFCDTLNREDMEPSEKAKRLALDTLLFTTQCAELGVLMVAPGEPRARLISTVAVGVTDSVREIHINKTEKGEIYATIIFRTAKICQEALGVWPGRLGPYEVTIIRSIDLLQAGSFGYLNRKSIGNSMLLLAKFFADLGNKLLHDSENCESGSGGSTRFDRLQLANGVSSQNSRQVNEEYRRLAKCTLGDLDEIPAIFRGKMTQYICSITKKPIRFIMVPAGYKQTLECPVYYEKTAIMNFFEEFPAETPHSWPAKLKKDRYSPIDVVAHDDYQLNIDRQLLQLLRDVKVNIARQDKRKELKSFI